MLTSSYAKQLSAPSGNEGTGRGSTISSYDATIGREWGCAARCSCKDCRTQNNKRKIHQHMLALTAKSLTADHCRPRHGLKTKIPSCLIHVAHPTCDSRRPIDKSSPLYMYAMRHAHAHDLTRHVGPKRRKQKCRALQKQLGNLDGVEGSPLLDLIAAHEQVQPLVIVAGNVTAHAADGDVVLVGHV